VEAIEENMSNVRFRTSQATAMLMLAGDGSPLNVVFDTPRGPLALALKWVEANRWGICGELWPDQAAPRNFEDGGDGWQRSILLDDAGAFPSMPLTAGTDLAFDAVLLAFNVSRMMAPATAAGRCPGCAL
jgi:hypothetical protein